MCSVVKIDSELYDIVLVPLLPRVDHFRCRRYELGYFQWLYDETP
jgi:hypothetical protein